MKKLFFLLILIPFLFGCEPMSMEETSPVTYMGGGKWTLTGYDIVVIQSISPITIVKNDTICINSFFETATVDGTVLLKQNYNATPISRRFIKNKTQWEFEGYNLYCAWVNGPGGMLPAHDPFWVTYPNNGFYNDFPIMEVSDYTVGTKTDFTFTTDNKGVAPPRKLVLISPNIILNLYSSSGARDKAATIQIILTFAR
jgi:hypothetical protein